MSPIEVASDPAMAASAKTASNETVDTIKTSINNLQAEQLDEISRHVREVQNHQTPLLRLPRELREEIYDLATLQDWRHCALPKGKAQSGFVIFRFEAMRKLGNACRQLKAECGDTITRLRKIGMVVMQYDTTSQNFNASWRTLSVAEIKALRRIKVWGMVFAGKDDAQRVLRHFESTSAYFTCGIVHFGAAVGIPPKLIRFEY